MLLLVAWFLCACTGGPPRVERPEREPWRRGPRFTAAEDLARAGKKDEARLAFRALRNERPADTLSFVREIDLTRGGPHAAELDEELAGLAAASGHEVTRARYVALRARLAESAAEREKLANDAVRIDETCSLAHDTLARLHDGRGKNDRAFEHWEKAAADPAALPGTVRAWAFALVDRRMLDRALAELEVYVESEPYDGEALYNLGTLYLVHRKDYSKAYAVLERAEAQAPDDLDVLLNLASAAMHSHRLDRVKPILDRAKRAAPEEPDVYFNYAVYYADHVDDRAAAIANFETYLKLGGKDVRRVNRWLEQLRSER